MCPDDISLQEVRTLLEVRRMTPRDLVTAAYYHAFEKPVPQGERERMIRQLEGRPDANGRLIYEPLPQYILAFL